MKTAASPTAPGGTGALARAPLAARRDPNFVSSLAKGLEILSAFAEGELLGNQQLVGRTGLPKATVSRLTSTLTELGYLRQDSRSRKFFMGTRLLGMGARVQRNIGLQRIARPFMEALAEETDLTVSMGTRDRLGVAFLDVIRPRMSRLVVNSDAGTVLPMESTAIGLAYLVAAPLAERTRILDGLRRRLAGDWEATRERIEKAHAEYRRSGFVSSQRSWGREVNAVAAPLFLQAKGGLFVFNCAGPTYQVSQLRMRSLLGPKLLQTIAAIRQAMEDTPQQPLNPPEVYEP